MSKQTDDELERLRSDNRKLIEAEAMAMALVMSHEGRIELLEQEFTKLQDERDMWRDIAFDLAGMAPTCGCCNAYATCKKETATDCINALKAQWEADHEQEIKYLHEFSGHNMTMTEETKPEPLAVGDTVNITGCEVAYISNDGFAVIKLPDDGTNEVIVPIGNLVKVEE